MTEPPTTKADLRPVYRRYLLKRHCMIRKNEPPTLAEISDAQALLRDSWDDDLRREALEILRLAGVDEE